MQLFKNPLDNLLRSNCAQCNLFAVRIDFWPQINTEQVRAGAIDHGNIITNRGACHGGAPNRCILCVCGVCGNRVKYFGHMRGYAAVWERPEPVALTITQYYD